MSLYEKYRPDKFGELRGNELEILKLKGSLKNPSRNNAIVIMGPTGVGKTTLGRIFSKVLLGLESIEELKAHQLEYSEIDAAELCGVDYVRYLKKRLRYGLSNQQIFLIDEASWITADAQGVLLKAIEDAPTGVFFIIITSEPDKLSPALMSRCSYYSLEPLLEGEMIEFLADTVLKEQADVNSEILPQIAERSQGRAREALVMLEEVMYIPVNMQMQALRKRIIEGTGVTICSKKNDESGIKFLASSSTENAKEESCLKAIETVACTSTDLLLKEFKPLRPYIRPFLLESALIMLFAAAGVGKTFILLFLVLLLTRKNGKGLSLGPLTVEGQCGVLLADGEMLTQGIQERVASLAGPLGPECDEYPLTVLTSDELFLQHGKRINLAEQCWRSAIYAYIEKNPVNKILVLDNIASLMPGISDNSKEAWDSVNLWLLSLRSLGVAVILVHHANRSGSYRGSSGRIDNLDTVIGLKSLKGPDELCFEVNYLKTRGAKKGGGQSFSLEAIEHEDNPDWLVWTEYDGEISKEVDNVQDKQIMAHAMLQKITQHEIAEIFSVSQGTVSNIKKQAIKDGLLTKEGQITEAGNSFLQEIDLELDE